jgi:diguanylate cyclase (GGDEF)-like protein
MVRLSPPPPVLRLVRAFGRAALLASLLQLVPLPLAAGGELDEPGREIEATLAAFPQEALAALTTLTRRTGDVDPAERRRLAGLQGQALILTGRVAAAREHANHLDAEAQSGRDPLLSAVARLIRSDIQWHAGDAAAAHTLAREAQAALAPGEDAFLGHWAALAAGTTARARGQFQDAVEHLHAALALAERAAEPNRHAAARYQLAVLMLALRQPQSAYEESLEAFRQAVTARNPYLMAKAKMAQSAALEILLRPAEEQAALEDALAIARATGSATTEALALVNLSDLRLRRKDARAAHDVARAALDIARRYNDVSLIATAKANMGFAQIAQGRAEAGKRLADEAVAAYERTGATAEIAELLGEYGQYLENAGDFRAALGLFHRQRKLSEEISLAAHDKSVLELSSRYEAERRRRDTELVDRANELRSAELSNRQLKERLWWLLAFVFAASFAVVAALYRKLRATNRLLARRNRELTSQSTQDPLTALYNRRYFQDFVRLETAVDERHRAEDNPAQGLFLIDLDHFKSVNDRYGHAAGDAVLVALSRRLRQTLREQDMIVRWGGEEFLVFAPDVAASRLDDIALRMMDAVSSEPVMFRGNAIRVTVSIGFAPMPLAPRDARLSWERTLGLVDMALYMAKLHGRNRAFGIKALPRDDPEALAIAERDLEAAWRDGVVDMQILVNGPRPELPSLVASGGMRAAA